MSSQKCLLFAFTLDDTHAELRDALARTQRIQWHRGVTVLALPDRLVAAVEAHLHTMDPLYVERLVRYQCNVLTLSAEKAQRFEYS